MLGALCPCFKAQHDANRASAFVASPSKPAAAAVAAAAPPPPLPPAAVAAAPAHAAADVALQQQPPLPAAEPQQPHGSGPDQPNAWQPTAMPMQGTGAAPLSPFAVAAVPAAHAVGTAPPPRPINGLTHSAGGAALGPLTPPDIGSSHCSSADSSLMNGTATNGAPRQTGMASSTGRTMNGQPSGTLAYSVNALGPNMPGAGTMSARPEELLMLGPLDNANMGLMARPASLQLHQLNRQITNLQKIGQGAGGIVYRGLWTGVNVAIKFLRSSSPDQLNQTAKEAILSRFVSHPNVVQTYTYDVTLLVDSGMGMHNNAHAHAQHPNAALAMPGILEEDPEPPTPSRDTNLDQGGIGTGTATGTGTGTGTGPNTPAGDGAAAGVNGAATSGEVGAERQPGAEAGSEGGAEQDAAALRTAAASTASQVQHAVQTTPSLAIFDVSQSTVDVRASLVSQPDMDSLAGGTGWDMQDVLLRLGAQPGEYLTHIIMELCDAGTLQQAVVQGHFGGSKDTSAERAKCRALLKTAREVASGMQHLHSLGIIHGDLKPGNVLLRKDASANSKTSFIAKVGDFGLAQRCVPGAPEVQAGVPLGTLCYAAPEALRGLLLKTSDVYSFGVMLWQMCSGEQPFHGLHPAQILYGKQTGTLKLTWPSEVYSPIRKLGELCTEPDPAARPHFDQICKALVQIEQRLQKVAKASGLTPMSSVQASMPDPQLLPEQQQPQQQQVVYELMPDPEILV